MSGTRHVFSLCLLCLALSGCGTGLPFLTESFKTGLSEREMQDLSFFVSSDITFRSIRELEPYNDEGPFKRDKRRIIVLEHTTPGTAVATGEGWLKIDFGQNILLTFRRNDQDGSYAMSGWGTLTIQEERYDILVGVLSGENVRLMYDLKKK